MTLTHLELGGAIALVGAGVFQIHTLYITHAGSLTDVRNALNGDRDTSLRLQDADILVGATALLVGGSVALATGKVHPLFIAVAGYVLIAAYYHSALNTSAPITEAMQ